MFGFFGKKPNPSSSIEDLNDLKRLMESLGMAKAGEIIRKQAQEGNVVCQVFLSQGALQYNLPDAEIYTRMAAESGDVLSQKNLALILIRKLDSSTEYHTEADIAIIREVKHWYRKAAAQGDREAHETLQDYVDAFPDETY